MAATQMKLRNEAWALMHEAILDSQIGGFENECEEQETPLHEAAHMLRVMGDEFNGEYKVKDKHQVISDIANYLKEEAAVMEKMHKGKDLESDFQNNADIFTTGALGKAYNYMTSRISGWFSDIKDDKKKMALVYNMVTRVGSTLRDSGKDVSLELNVITALGGQFIVDKFSTPSHGSYVDMIRA